MTDFVWRVTKFTVGSEWWFLYADDGKVATNYIADVFFIPPQPPEKPDVYIAWIGVKEQWQRQGLATMMLDRITEQYHCSIDFGTMTVDGEALHDAYVARVT